MLTPGQHRQPIRVRWAWLRVFRFLDRMPYFYFLKEWFWLHCHGLASKFLEREVKWTERIIEYALVFQHLGPPNQTRRILDVGCDGSLFPIQLASLGHRVHGLDVNDCPHKHPNFVFVKGDAMRMPFGASSFDLITAISTIEHVGFGAYTDPKSPEGDRKVVLELKRILAVGGEALITVPYPRAERAYMPITYDYGNGRLEEVFGGLKIRKEEYYVVEKNWVLPCSKKFLDETNKRGVVFIKAVNE